MGTPGGSASPGVREGDDVETIQLRVPSALHVQLEEIAQRWAISVDQLLLMVAVQTITTQAAFLDSSPSRSHPLVSCSSLRDALDRSREDE